MDPPATGLDSTQSNDGGKVKKARKRPKTSSCIPCSKKRQVSRLKSGSCVLRAWVLQQAPISLHVRPGMIQRTLVVRFFETLSRVYHSSRVLVRLGRRSAGTLTTAR